MCSQVVVNSPRPAVSCRLNAFLHTTSSSARASSASEGGVADTPRGRRSWRPPWTPTSHCTSSLTSTRHKFCSSRLRRNDVQPHSPHTHPERHSRQQTRRQHRTAAGPRTQQPHAGGSRRDGTARAHLTASDQPHPISRGRPRLHKPSSTQRHRRESHTQAIPPVTLVRSGLRTVRRHDSCGGQRRSGQRHGP